MKKNTKRKKNIVVCVCVCACACESRDVGDATKRKAAKKHNHKKDSIFLKKTKTDRHAARTRCPISIDQTNHRTVSRIVSVDLFYFNHPSVVLFRISACFLRFWRWKRSRCERFCEICAFRSNAIHLPSPTIHNELNTRVARFCHGEVASTATSVIFRCKFALSGNFFRFLFLVSLLFGERMLGQ